MSLSPFAVDPGLVTATAVSDDAWLLSVSLDSGTPPALRGAAWAQRGSLRAFLHGSLFDSGELAASLGVQSRDTSDASLVLTAVERWGDAGLARLRGSFALAVVDSARNQVLIARDPLGSHPLFYAKAGGRVLFSTDPRGLLAERGVSRNLSAAAVADHLCSRWPDPHETFFSGIQRVPPGWRARIADGTLDLERYWDPVPRHGEPIEWLSDAETERFSDVLDRAVLRCLSVGRAGIFLSGGFDSVSIAAVAVDQARRTGREVPVALSLAFPDPECDERERQSHVAGALGVPHRLVDFREAVAPRGLIAAGVALNRSLAFPLFNAWAPAYLDLARRGLPDGIKTILTGSGGDEWLGVTPFLAADLIRGGDLIGLARFVRMWGRSYAVPTHLALKNTLWTFGLRPLGGMWLQRLAPALLARGRAKRNQRADPPWLAPDPALRDELRSRVPRVLPAADPAGGFYARESRASLDHMLVSRDMEEQYQFGRRLGVRYMHPYWDADLATQIYRTRPEALIRGGRAKGLVRETVARRFPGLGFERQRKVLALSFFMSMVAKEGPAVAAQVGNFEALEAAGVVDAGRAGAFVREAFRTGGRDMLMAVHLFHLETWARDYV